ncbi:hypothetical protein EGW08_001337 [Elysia chlorotica]|uniref:BHLH domain-containing protein n=1 Tax=Elysia chlorotica TaxID=188477 RepID=A0A3S1CF24_ELYCH|nr:hypothetical protein EGW08_001337 [Elysia chlorotica]
MASAKLVNVHAHHHISPSRHRAPPPLHRACPSPLTFKRHQQQQQPQSPAMTLDYSLPRGRDLETGSPPHHGIETDQHGHLQSGLDLSDMKGRGLDLHPEPESGRDDACFSSPPSHASEDHDNLADTPTKKNKRKLSSPRRRADISDDESSVKQPKRKKKHSRPSASPTGEDEDSGIDSYKSVDDTILDVVGGASGPDIVESPSLEKTAVRGSTKDSCGSGKRNTASSKSLSSSSSSLSEKRPSASSKTKSRKKSSVPNTDNNRPSSSSSSRQCSNNTDSHADVDNHKHSASPSPHAPHVHPALPPNFLYPMLGTPGVPTAAALGLVPGLYFGHPGLHPSLPVLPPHVQQAYVAAAAAAAAQSSALVPPPPATPSSSSSSERPSASSPSQAMYIPSPLPTSLLPSMLYPGVAPRAETTVSDSRRKHPSAASSSTGEKQPSSKSIAQSSKLQRHQRQSTSSASSTSPQPQQSKISSASTSSLQPGLFHPSSHGSSSSTNNLIPLPSEPYPGPSTSSVCGDPNDSSSSRPQSPEDLSMPGGSGGARMSRKHRKNYKNMTRERRVEANARERTRVHTISAAFEALRRAVPSYSHNQKLSKLAILRIACSYIMSLARLGDMDYTSASEHIGQPLDFSECVEMTTNTIQTEGRARRRH